MAPIEWMLGVQESNYHDSRRHSIFYVECAPEKNPPRDPSRTEE